MIDRERRKQAAHALYPEQMEIAINGQSYDLNSDARTGFITGAGYEATHWEARVKGLRAAATQVFVSLTENPNGPPKWVIDELEQALAAFRASDTSSDGGST